MTARMTGWRKLPGHDDSVWPGGSASAMIRWLAGEHEIKRDDARALLAQARAVFDQQGAGSVAEFALPDGRKLSVQYVSQSRFYRFEVTA